jgi:predicted permease
LAVLIEILVNDLLPIFLVAAVGFALARYAHADVRTLSRVTFYALSPCLIFYQLTSSSLSPAVFGQMALFSLALALCVGALGWLLLRPLKLAPTLATAALMTIMFANAGNLGLPMVLFAYGDEALARATVFFAVNAMLMYSLGVFMACSGQHGLRHAVRNVIRVPAIYALIFALAALLTHTAIPAPINRGVQLLSGAALPAMILVLGMQLERAGRITRVPLVAMAASLKLVVAPLIGLGLALLLGLTGASKQAGISQAGTPAAVLMTILALEYDVEPAFVTNVVFISTLLSPLTLTVIIALLK